MSESRDRANAVFTFIQGDPTWRQTNRITKVAQERVRTFLGDCLHLGEHFFMLAAAPNGYTEAGIQEMDREIARVNQTIAPYSSSAQIVFDPSQRVVGSFVERFNVRPGITLAECAAMRNIFALLEDADIMNVCACASPTCNRYLYRERVSEQWCSDQCRQKAWLKTSTFKAIRAARAKIEYHRNLATDARHKGNMSKEAQHIAHIQTATAHLDELQLKATASTKTNDDDYCVKMLSRAKRNEAAREAHRT